MPLFDVDEGQIYYEERGRGDSPLVFVHGLACALEDWDEQRSHFASSRRVVCLDQRGHGRSGAFTRGFDILSYATDLAALIAGLRLPPVVLIGHSMGCRVILECARQSPECVAGLVLIDGSHLASGDAAFARRATRKAIEESGYEAFFERLFSQMFTPVSDPAVRDRIIARAKRLPQNVGLELMPQMAAWDTEFAEIALGNLKAPVKVLQSTYMNADRNRVSLQVGETNPWLELIKKLVPAAEVEIVPGVGHFTMIEAAEVVNRHIGAAMRFDG